MNNLPQNNLNYRTLLVEIKQQIRSAQTKAALTVNASLIQLYWSIGKMISENQTLFEGRNNYVSLLAKDLREDFSDLNGFSERNLFYARRFYNFYAAFSLQQAVAVKTVADEISLQQVAAPNPVQQAVGLTDLLYQVPWGHHILILTKIKETNQAIFYLQQTIEFNWSRTILILQIEQNLYQRQGNAITNFKKTLPEQQAALASQILKDPYNFGFLTLEKNLQEREIEKQLTTHITKFLLELGKGFAFIGRQYPLQVGEKDYRLDLLFYHIKLRCFVVIELKTGEFEPEFAGKMNFYLSVVDDQLKTETDQPSIGIILCKSKDKLEVEYALQGMSKPIGVSEFKVSQALPAEFKSSLPTIEEFENELKNDTI